MSHWPDQSPADDAGESFVRPYTITHGRTAPTNDDLTLITLISTIAPPDDQLTVRGLEPEHRMILRHCRRPAAVAELASMLNLPVAVAKILIGDLMMRGLVLARAPPAVAVGQGPDLALLEAVRDGLRRL